MILINFLDSLFGFFGERNLQLISVSESIWWIARVNDTFIDCVSRCICGSVCIAFEVFLFRWASCIEFIFLWINPSLEISLFDGDFEQSISSYLLLLAYADTLWFSRLTAFNVRWKMNLMVFRFKRTAHGLHITNHWHVHNALGFYYYLFVIVSLWPAKRYNSDGSRLCRLSRIYHLKTQNREINLL